MRIPLGISAEEDVIARVREVSAKTGIPISRIYENAVLKELKVLEKIYQQQNPSE